MHEQPHALSRRSFVSSITGGLGTVALWPACLQAKERTLPPLSFVIVTDTHLGYRDNPSAAKRWQKTAVEVNKAKGDFVLHLGDIVDAGREPQYPLYLETRKTIRKPVYEIPGNHDPLPLFEKYIRKQVDTVVDHQWLRVLLVGNAHTDSHDGFLTKEQLAWIDTQCAEVAKQGRFVAIAMHVPAHKNRHPDRGWYVKPDQGQTTLYKLLDKHKDHVLCLMHGHFHNGIRGWDDHGPLHEILFPSALYNLDRKLMEKKAPGYNLPEFRPGYTLVTIKEGAMLLQYKPVDVDETTDRELKLLQLAE